MRSSLSAALLYYKDEPVTLDASEQAPDGMLNLEGASIRLADDKR